MKRSLALPFYVLSALAVLSTILVLYLDLSQPWMGLRLAPAESGLRVTGVAETGPGAAIAPGTILTGISTGEARVALDAIDKMEEPDGLPTVTRLYEFFAKQGQMHDMLRSGQVLLTTAGGDSISVAPRDTRPVADLPVVFWVQLFVGFAATLLGGWVLSMRSREPAAGYLALSGVGLLISSHAAAFYSTRELAVAEQVFAWASSINSLGAITFGIGMISLFLVYPARYLPKWAPGLVVAVFGTWGLLAYFRVPEPMAFNIHLPVLIEMSLIVVAAIGQVFATRGKPSERAALRWFGLSVVIGAGGFVSLIALPQALGLQPQISQGYAFALFLIVYVGLGLGVARYRLFDLEFWAFRALFYAGGVALLLLLDALLIFAVTMDRIPAFSFSLLFVALVYLPARDTMARWLNGRQVLSTADLFDLVSGVALAPTGPEQRQKMIDLLAELFQPIRIEPAPAPVVQPALRQEGEAMDVPGIDGVEDLRMHWPHRGRRLFSAQDAARVSNVLQMASQFVERRRAYEAGAEQERQRINRDMHDNIGVQLLGALHSSDAGRKNDLIRQTLTDLRETVSNPSGEPTELTVLLADMRAEIGEHLASGGVALDWQVDVPDIRVSPMAVNSIRAILREGASNILHHAACDRAEIRVSQGEGREADHLVLTISDNGGGFDPDRLMQKPVGGRGNGLRNLRSRTEARGGSFAIRTAPNGTGTTLRAALPLGADPVPLVYLRDAGE
ncbi:sensor histidine kinase [Pseudooceanicola atlanticus]|uniref:sensor histidine kinase n=1 Tax=Pseudooceanicola atlanticus TaxID=1461694 RepID=UPI000693653D|nr:ATP-binding protein [Pseudooceanicola atlanticus]